MKKNSLVALLQAKLRSIIALYFCSKDADALPTPPEWEIVSPDGTADSCIVKHCGTEIQKRITYLDITG